MTDDIWLPGFERLTPAPGAYAGTMVPGAPRRFVCHFTQGFSANPASSASRHPNPPQLWVCLPSHPYKPGWRGQVYPLNVSARALNHDRSDPETNKQGAIQVEIEGFSEDAADLTRADLDWLADMVLGPACAATGVDVSVFIQGVADSRAAAGRRSATRMSWAQWARFNGICSHQNVPGNDHWDAGGLDLAYISARLTGADDTTPTSPQPSEEDDMKTLFVRGQNRGEVIQCDQDVVPRLVVQSEDHLKDTAYLIRTTTRGEIIGTPGKAGFVDQVGVPVLVISDRYADELMHTLKG